MELPRRQIMGLGRGRLIKSPPLKSPAVSIIPEGPPVNVPLNAGPTVCTPEVASKDAVLSAGPNRESVSQTEAVRSQNISTIRIGRGRGLRARSPPRRPAISAGLGIHPVLLDALQKVSTPEINVGSVAGTHKSPSERRVIHAEPEKSLNGALESKCHSRLTDIGVKVSLEPFSTSRLRSSYPEKIQGSRSGDLKIHSDDRRRVERFFEHADFTQWIVMDCAGAGQRACIVASKFHGAAVRLRFPKASQALAVISVPNEVDLSQILERVLSYRLNEKLPILAVFILSSDQDASFSYGELKRMTETNPQYSGIVTQCLQKFNVMTDGKLTRSYIDNVMKKINVKLGGSNSRSDMTAKLLQGNVLVLGATVTYALEGDNLTPSIAAVVGSLNDIFTKYRTEIRVQVNEHDVQFEYIKDLKEVTKAILRAHYAATKKKPERIIYLRDGVAENQFDEVRKWELEALRDACREIQLDYKPSLMAVVAQKVLHDSNRVSHSGSGATLPTDYHLIHTDEAVNTDDLTELLLQLCHSSARSSNKASNPTPIYYAHRAAIRAREHVRDVCPTPIKPYTILTPEQIGDLVQACRVTPCLRDKLYYI